MLTLPRIRDRMHDVVKRGGLVLVIPAKPRRRRSSTGFPSCPTPTLLLLSPLQVMFAEKLANQAATARRADGLAWLARLAAPFPPEATEPHTGIAPELVGGWRVTWPSRRAPRSTAV